MAYADWHRLQVLLTPGQYKWLKAESYTRGESIGAIIRELIVQAAADQKVESTQ